VNDTSRIFEFEHHNARAKYGQSPFVISTAFVLLLQHAAQFLKRVGTTVCPVGLRSRHTTLIAMTAALSDASQWDGYSFWLPLIAD
jgi:hypothetical protein